MIGEHSPTQTYPKCVSGFVWVCMRLFSIASISAHTSRQCGNGPLVLTNAIVLVKIPLNNLKTTIQAMVLLGEW
jgi:hypothetical protein